MEFDFLFWLFLFGIVVATLQDIKRREVDNWLNLLLMISGMMYVFYGAVLSGDCGAVFHFGFVLVVMFVLMNLFYYGRVFAGGDAKLLFAMAAVFVGGTFLDSMINIGVFSLFLMISGSFYGLFYSGILWFKNFDNVNKEIRKQVAGRRSQVAGFVIIGLMMLGFVDLIFLLLGILVFIFLLLYVFAKGLENVSMIREVSGLELREGDWLVEDVVVGSDKLGVKNQKVVRASWDGLSLSDIGLLKNNEKVLIKEGLPFVPAFLIAYLGYWFFGALLG